jgi:hypothetical protein
LTPEASNKIQDLCDLPLVSPLGSLSSTRRWDQLGAFKIGQQKTRRFDQLSYYGEKPFSPDLARPLPLIEPEVNKFARQTCHTFRPLEKPVEPVFLTDRKELYRHIIRGKKPVSELRRVL